MSGYTVTQCYHLPRPLHAQRARQSHRVRARLCILALAGVDIHEVDAGMVHANEHGSGLRSGHRGIDTLQDFGTAVLMNLDGFHGNAFLRLFGIRELSRIPGMSFDLM